MYSLTLDKPDGRKLYLYARRPLPEDLRAPPQEPAGAPPNAHLRWHPLRGEWVAYASHHQNRTVLRPPEYDPLAPTTDPDQPTEVPAGPWDVAVFENRFPTLTMAAHDPPHELVLTRSGRGVCEVVVFTQDARASLASLPLAQLETIVAVWAARQADLGARPEVQYVLPFANRGVDVGVTLHHPHGEIHAYPFVPPIAARELYEQAAHLERTGHGLLEEHLLAEQRDGRRIVYSGDDVLAFVPVCARYPSEVWIAPRRVVPALDELAARERADLARALKTVLMKLDGSWRRPMPYLLVLHQAPTDGQLHPEAHVHIEIYPALRMPERREYLAGSEMGAGVFTADTLPEEQAAELRAVEVDLE
jgi:UDPglucose--hexose-1-phosphate uridylyltransferase